MPVSYTSRCMICDNETSTTYTCCLCDKTVCTDCTVGDRFDLCLDCYQTENPECCCGQQRNTEAIVTALAMHNDGRFHLSDFRNLLLVYGFRPQDKFFIEKGEEG